MVSIIPFTITKGLFFVKTIEEASLLHDKFGAHHGKR